MYSMIKIFRESKGPQEFRIAEMDGILEPQSKTPKLVGPIWGEKGKGTLFLWLAWVYREWSYTQSTPALSEAPALPLLMHLVRYDAAYSHSFLRLSQSLEWSLDFLFPWFHLRQWPPILKGEAVKEKAERKQKANLKGKRLSGWKCYLI